MPTRFLKAIQELLDQIEVRPRDAMLRQRVAELHQKAGRTKEAALHFAQIAALYAEEGHFLKAVALLKQVLKLDPGLAMAHEALAEAYENLGLNEDAAQQWVWLLETHRMLQGSAEVQRILERLAKLGHRDATPS